MVQPRDSRVAIIHMSQSPPEGQVHSAIQPPDTSSTIILVKLDCSCSADLHNYFVTASSLHSIRSSNNNKMCSSCISSQRNMYFLGEGKGNIRRLDVDPRWLRELFYVKPRFNPITKQY